MKGCFVRCDHQATPRRPMTGIECIKTVRETSTRPSPDDGEPNLESAIRALAAMTGAWKRKSTHAVHFRHEPISCGPSYIDGLKPVQAKPAGQSLRPTPQYLPQMFPAPAATQSYPTWQSVTVVHACPSVDVEETLEQDVADALATQVVPSGQATCVSSGCCGDTGLQWGSQTPVTPASLVYGAH